jgi:hypothetical protein
MTEKDQAHLEGPTVTAKLAGAGLGAAVATLIIWIVEETTHINLEAPIEGAIATLAAFVTGLFVSDGTRGFMKRRADRKAEHEVTEVHRSDSNGGPGPFVG